MCVEMCISPEKVLSKELFILPNFEKFEAALINVPVDFQQGVTPDGEEPPIGLGRIASYANVVNGHKVGIYDVHRAQKPDGSKLSISDVKDTLATLKDQGIKVVGLNPTSVNIEAGVEIAEICDELRIPYVLGGYFATLSDKSAINRAFPNALAVVRRDGEIAFSEILWRLKNYEGELVDSEQLRDRLKLKSIAGVYGPNDDEIVDVFAPKLALERLPLIKPSEYFIRHLEEVTVKGKKYQECTIFTTDGCPYDCGFCSSPVMNQSKDYLHPGMKRFVDEIETAIKDGANAIHCTDDLIFTKGAQIDELYHELDNRGLLGKFIWRGMGRANVINRLTEQQLEHLKLSGCWQLALGVESGSPRILKEVINKRLKPQDVLNATRSLTQHGIGTKGFFIFGFPVETIEDIRLSYQLALDMAKEGATGIAAFEFHPYPGTKLYEYIVKNMPWIIPQLEYLAVDWSEIGQDDAVGIGRARVKAAKTSMWLPEKMRISHMSSKSIRVAVLKTIADFETIKEARLAKMREEIRAAHLKIQHEKVLTGLETMTSSILLLLASFPEFTFAAIPAFMGFADAARRANEIDKISKKYPDKDII